MSYAGTYGADETCKHGTYVRSCAVCSRSGASWGSLEAKVKRLEAENNALRERLTVTEAVAKRMLCGFAPVIVSPEAGSWYWHRSMNGEESRWEPMSDDERQVLDRLNEPSPE